MLKVRYNPVVAWTFLALGAINLVLGLWLLVLGSVNLSLVGGACFLAVGAGYLTRPYFTVAERSVTVPALFGPASRRFAMTGSERLACDGGRLLVGDRRLPVRRYLAHPDDWRSVLRRAAAPE